MNTFLLAAHVGLGLGSLGCCLNGVRGVFSGKPEKVKFWMKIIGIMTVLAAVSGLGLVLVRGGWGPFCVKMSVYLAVISGVEGLLYYKLSRLKVSLL